MSFVVVLLGLIVLATLSVGVGIVIGGERLARERRRLAAVRWELWRWEQELFLAVETDGCPSCALLRRRAELHRSPNDVLRS